jgi:hypothetical protein
MLARGIRLSFTAFLLGAAVTPAGATLSCIYQPVPFELASDIVTWSMKIEAGHECIQGLRWSTMQIENVSIETQPKSGRVVLVGPGFRYYANSDAKVADSFEISVIGTRIKSHGRSTIKIEVSAPEANRRSSAAN